MRLIFALLTMGIAAAGYAEQYPNIVLFYVDDLGWADTSVRMMDTDSDSASDFHQTPHLEKLANRGMKFSCATRPPMLLQERVFNLGKRPDV